MQSGIYKITNISNGKFYIGSSKNIHKRWIRHLRDLKNGEHNNVHLQRAFNLGGQEAFKFEILENCEENMLLIIEQSYLDKTRCWDAQIGYNIGRSASGGDNLSSHPNKENIIQRITDSTRKYLDNLTEEEKRIKSENSSGDKNPNWKGGVSSPKCLSCGADISYSRKRCLTCCKIGNLNPFYGKVHSKETIEKIREKALVRGSTIKGQTIKINNIIFQSKSKAAKHFGVTVTTISNWVGRKVKMPNHIYEIILLQDT